MVKYLERKLSAVTATLFHRLYYYSRNSWQSNTFLGYPIQQNPIDMYIYQELIYRLRPQYIIQTGIFNGGSILYFAKLLDLIESPQDTPVIGIDISLSVKARTLSHPRIQLIEGDSINAKTIDRVSALLKGSVGLVSLDSNHSQRHVFRELQLYSSITAIGSYIVVEDTNVNGHPVCTKHGPGPLEAVNEFLAQDKRFIRDDEIWSRHFLSHHQRGFLKRIR